MQLSLSTEYAIHSLYYLALQGNNKHILVSDIAKVQNISVSYLAKVLQKLSSAGLIKSYRGAKGGYVLAQEPAKISLKQIVLTMEGSSPIFVCDDQKRNCILLGECVITSVMNEAEQKMMEVLEQTSLADLLKNLVEKGNGEDVSFWANNQIKKTE